jgi:hypothetical protein
VGRTSYVTYDPKNGAGEGVSEFGVLCRLRIFPPTSCGVLSRLCFEELNNFEFQYFEIDESEVEADD